jgi:3-oxoacyl-[acyl-carrier-protein] synthase-3
LAKFSIQDVQITGIAACIPPIVIRNSDSQIFENEIERDKVIQLIGIDERRFADDATTASDLCVKAADKLIEELKIDKNSIDVLIYLSQTSDYITPATSPSLQHRLGLSTDTMCFDINLACSGYVYALSTAFTYAAIPGIRSVLLLNGETFSKIVSPLDKVNFPLYGDAGTATLIEKKPGCKSFFELYSDGSGKESVFIPAGGTRNRTTTQSIQSTEREDNNFRNDHQIYMNGLDVFNFAIRRVPTSIKSILKNTGISIDDISYVYFHQANKFMTDFIAKKMKIPLTKVPYSLDKYGNTSSCSIPLTIVSEKSITPDLTTSLLIGFGGGLSWGTAIVDLSDCHIINIIEY